MKDPLKFYVKGNKVADSRSFYTFVVVHKVELAEKNVVTPVKEYRP